MYYNRIRIRTFLNGQTTLIYEKYLKLAYTKQPRSGRARFKHFEYKTFIRGLTFNFLYSGLLTAPNIRFTYTQVSL